MVDLDQLRTPKADNPVQAKFTLSSTMRDKLREASRISGQDMSTLVEFLIRDHLDVGSGQFKEKQEERIQDNGQRFLTDL